MSTPTLRAQVSALTDAVAALTALVTPLVIPTGNTVAPVGAQVPAPEAHKGPSGKPDGREFVCTLGCGKRVRSAEAAASHDSTQPKWHAAA